MFVNHLTHEYPEYINQIKFVIVRGGSLEVKKTHTHKPKLVDNKQRLPAIVMLKYGLER